MAGVSETVANRPPARTDDGRSAKRPVAGTAPGRARARPPTGLLSEGELRTLLEQGTPADVADVLLSRTEDERRAMAGMVQNLGTLSAAPHADNPGRAAATEQREAALLVAGAACLTDATAVVSWLRSRRFRHTPSPDALAALVQVLATPGRPGLAAVGDGLADARAPRQREWVIAAAALHAAGLPPPASEAAIRAWVRAHAAADPAALAADAWLDDLLPRLFDLPLDRAWPEAFARLASNGRLERAELFRLTLRRMRDDQAGVQRTAVNTYRLLEPTPDERAAHVPDYLLLLASPHIIVAELAQHQLRELDEAGRLDVAEVAEAGRAVLTRTEQRLIRTQLAWLAQAVARRPEGAGTLLEAMAAGLTNESVAIAERVLAALAVQPGGRDLLAGMAAGLGGYLRDRADKLLDTAAGLPGTAAGLPGTTGGQSGTAAGQPSTAAGQSGTAAGQPSTAADQPSTAGSPPGTAADQPGTAGSPPGTAASPPGTAGGGTLSPGVAGDRRRLFPSAPRGHVSSPMPAPIATVAELADCLRGSLDPVAVERVLAGVVTLAQTSRATMASTFAPLVDVVVAPFAEIVRVLAAPNIRPESDAPAEPPRYGVGREKQPPPGRRLAGGFLREPRSHRAYVDGGGSSPQTVLLGRIGEVAEQLASSGPPPWLLATPATVDGHVNPARVLLLLVQAERGGWQPGPHDLAQALLRLPRHVDASVVEAAARLASPAGRRFAAWLQAGGLPDRPFTVVAPAGDPAHRTVAAARSSMPCAPPPHGRMSSTPHVIGLAIPQGLLTPTPRLSAAVAEPARGTVADPAVDNDVGASAQQQPRVEEIPDMRCWPMVLPGHREVIAAHCLPFIEAVADHGHDAGLEILGELARAAGPFGPAMALALAHGLAAVRDQDRLAAVEAVIHLTATDGLDAELVGRELAVLLAADGAAASRTAEPLGLVGRGGAWHVVWAVAHAVLPVLLRVDEPPRAGLSALLAVANAAAAATGARSEMPELTAVAARADGSRLCAEAAHLARTIS